ncbi:MAG: DUF1254 domain-containing protein [Pseudomonadota bacterium]
MTRKNIHPHTPAAQSRLGWRAWRGGLLALLALIAGSGAVLYTQAEYIVLGAEGYLYGYPLVITDLTRAHASQALGPENQLYRLRRFPDAQFRGVVRPNVDTLYTSAFVDMAQGPWVFEMPSNAQRYELMPFMDAWTNVIASPGTRTTGTGGGQFLLVGPEWPGAAPSGLTLLRSPTRWVWLIGRTQTNGASDYPTVHALQDGLSLRRLNAIAPNNEPPPKRTEPTTPASPPLATMKAMATLDFFKRLSALMVDNPPAAADGPMLLKLARIGVAPGQPPQWNPLQRAAASLGRWIADFKVKQELNKLSDPHGAWVTPPAVLGQYGTHYNIRAAVAMVGLGANWPADASYPNTRSDDQGRALNGQHRYRLHFAADNLPPVRAFWSVTAYGPDDYLIDNPLQRYALGDRDPLVYNADGSLDLWIQASAPAGAPANNWLPVKAGEDFSLTARLYWPQAAALDARWHMPAVQRID